MNLTDIVTEALSAYSERAVSNVEVVRDPHNPCMVVARADLKGYGTSLGFLLEVHRGVADVDSIEEVTFDTWPPQVRAW